MLAPRTHQIHRTHTYGSLHPTTSKKNLNKENAHALPSKTPSRVGGKQLIGPSTGVRMGLGVKTEGRDRNVLVQQQGGGKGKGREGDDIEPKRLFANGPSKSSTSIPPSKSLSSMPPIPSMPHRTPAPRRAAPAPSNNLRTPAPFTFTSHPAPVPAPTPLPSATRTRRRSRQSLSNISLTPLKSSIEQQEAPPQPNFVTPAPVRWDEEVSLGSVEVEGLEGVKEVEEEEDGDVEYMPPPVQELPYDPGWDVPDVTRIFTTLAAMPPLWMMDGEITEVPELVFVEESVKMTLDDDEALEEEYMRAPARSIPTSAAPKPNATRPTSNHPLIRPPTSSSTTTVPRRPPTAPLPSRANLKPTLPSRTVTKPPAPVPRPPIRPTARPVPTPGSGPGQRPGTGMSARTGAQPTRPALAAKPSIPRLNAPQAEEKLKMDDLEKDGLCDSWGDVRAEEVLLDWEGIGA
ncbi:hypothetical protein IAT38_005611 [Cryptococcus sp. DSM 104549]